MSNKFFSTEQLATAAGVSVKTINRRQADGKIAPAVHHARLRLWTREQAETIRRLNRRGK